MTGLVIDTAFDTCQAALVKDGTLVASQALVGEGRHDVALAPLVQNLLHDQNISVSGLSYVAVTTGPGRFTSLRVGISFARALVIPAGLPLYGLATGDALASYIKEHHPDWQKPGRLVIVKRGEIFVQGSDQVEPVSQPVADLPAWLSCHQIDGVAGIGAGVPTLWDEILPPALPRVALDCLPLPVLARIADRHFTVAPAGDHVVRPFYGTSTGI